MVKLVIGALGVLLLLAWGGVPGTFGLLELGLGLALWRLWSRVQSLERQVSELQLAQQPTPMTRTAVADEEPLAVAEPERAGMEELPRDAPSAMLPAATAALGTAPTELPPSRDARHEPDESSVDVVSSLGRSIQAWVSGGNTIVRAAVAILFIGVAFLLRYAAEHSLIPIELRLAGVALGGLALVGVGWRLRHARRGYALSLQGGGIGVIYLTLFAAFRLYGLLPGGLAFALLAALAACSAVLAVGQNALPLAVLGFAGGFLAPVLTSTGQGSHVALFSYYLVLNLAIAWIASRQTWKLLNLLGFFFTFGIGLAWGLKSWKPELLASTEPFLIAHVLLFLYVSVRYSQQLVRARETQPNLPYVDGGLVFGMPIAAFGLQAPMVHHIPYALACSAAVMAAIYLVLGRWLLRQGGQRTLLLTEATLALGVIFLALVTPLALDARWTGAAWAVEGAGLAWIAVRQQRLWAMAMGLLLQVGAALSFWSSYVRTADMGLFTNSLFVGALVLSLAALFTARMLEREARGQPSDAPWLKGLDLRALHWMGLGAGVFYLLAGAWPELVAAPWHRPDLPGRLIALLLGCTLIGELSHRRLDWPALRVPGRLTWALAALASLTTAVESMFSSMSSAWTRLLEQGALECLAVLLIGAWALWRRDRDASRANPATAAPAQWLRHVAAAEHLMLGWFALLQGSLTLYMVCANTITRHEAWTPAALIAAPSLMALALTRRLAAGKWPLSAHPQAWLKGLLEPWLALLMVWIAAANAWADGSMQPLGYLPLLNPIDLGHGLILIYALHLARACAAAPGCKLWPVWPLVGAAAAFAWLNGLLIRTLHHWAGTPMWDTGALQSGLVQTSLTMLWTLIALVTMLYATRRAAPRLSRYIWMAGAGLLGVVVLKLLVVDMAGIGALERIVSFIGVGLLMLVIGYVSPLPPAVATPDSAPTHPGTSTA